MSLDHEAIIKAYPEASSINDDFGVLKKDGSKITLDNTKITAARKILDDEYAAKKYQRDRVAAYPTIQDQLDMQYWDKKNGTTTWVDAIAKVKSDNPKP
tara:strand:- start:610 stop:906 length:297 start_codon:yes stop_codon:yes gene_type:complete